MNFGGSTEFVAVVELDAMPSAAHWAWASALAYAYKNEISGFLS